MRKTTLCSLLPVKYCIAAPKLSDPSARTSTCNRSTSEGDAGFVYALPEGFLRFGMSHNVTSVRQHPGQ